MKTLSWKTRLPNPRDLGLRHPTRLLGVPFAVKFWLLAVGVMLAMERHARAQTDTLLTSGVTYDSGSALGLVGSDDLPLYFRVVVPSGQTKLIVETGGGSGGVDLYVRRGARPTFTTYDAVSLGLTTAESVTIPNPAADIYYIMLAGSGFFQVAVRATYASGTLPPDWQWAKSTQSENASITSPQANGMAVDADGNAYVAGWYQGTIAIGALQMTASAVQYPGLPYGQSGFIVKYSPTGQALWAANNVGEQATAVSVSADGYVYVTGSFTGTVMFTNGTAITLLKTLRRYETFVAKYRADSGALVWANAYPGVGDNIGNAIAVGAGARATIVVGGYETRATSRVPGGTYIARWLQIDANGGKVSDNSLVGDDLSYISGVATDASGNVYLAGGFKSMLPIAGAANLISTRNQNGSPTEDAFFAKLNQAGKAVWATAADGGGIDDAATALALDTAGDVLGSGVTGAGYFAIRYDSVGNRSWALTSNSGVGADYATTIVSDGHGGAYWAGTFSGTFDFGLGSLRSGTPHTDSTGGFLIGLSGDGNVQWAVQTDGRASAVAANSSGGIYMAGGYYGSATFGDTLVSTSRREMFVGKLASQAAPTITAQPTDQSGVVGGAVTFSVTATGTSPVTYQWKKNGVTIAGAMSATLVLNNLTAADAGTYGVVVTNGIGTVTSRSAALRVSAAASRLINLSVRSLAGTGDRTLIVGFAIAGQPAKQVLIRGIGPTLGQFGVSNVVEDPALELYEGSMEMAQNDNWGGAQRLADAFSATGAFGLSGGSKDAAILIQLSSKAYSAQLVSSHGGVALIEVYDADAGSPTSRLVNLSARDQVGTGGDVLIIGFVISGNAPKTLLIRGVGPTLAQFGVGGTLADPKLDLFSGQTIIQSNDNWGGGAALNDAFSRVGAFGLPANSRDAAMMATLQPGAYTAQVSGVGGTTGVALVEVYEMP